MAKYYFRNVDSENCFALDSIKDQMRFEGITETKVFEAQIEYGTDHFWCAEFGDIGVKYDSECGNSCKSYKPRNGKSGRCVSHKNCYIHSKEVTIKLKK